MECPYCEGRVTESAKKCRHCGEWLVREPGRSWSRHDHAAPVGEDGSARAGCLTGEISPRTLKGCLGALAAFIALASWFSWTATNNLQPGPSSFAMKSACEASIRAQVNSPSTAEFSPIEETRITASGGKKTVRGWVDAPNDFGATVRNSYACSGVRIGSDWSVTAADLLRGDPEDGPSAQVLKAPPPPPNEIVATTPVRTLSDFMTSRFCEAYGCRVQRRWDLRSGGENVYIKIDYEPDVAVELHLQNSTVVSAGFNLFNRRDAANQLRLRDTDAPLARALARTLTGQRCGDATASLERRMDVLVQHIGDAKATSCGGWSVRAGLIVDPVVAFSRQ